MANEPLFEEEVEDFPSDLPVPSEEVQAMVMDLESTLATMGDLSDVADINDPRLAQLKKMVQSIEQKFSEELDIELENEDLTADFFDDTD